jgi:acetyltransferase-like isoleucine patch superfamily enzyme
MSETRREYLIHFWGRVKALLYTKFLSGSFFGVGEGTRIIPPFRFLNLSQVQLGKKVMVHKYCFIQVLEKLKGIDPTIRPKVIIGDGVTIAENVIISAAKKIILEEGVAVAKNVLITDHHHSYQDVEKSIMEYVIEGLEEVRICTNAWVGQNSIVMPGVTIGKNSVIGAQSIVNKDIPDYCVAVGTPAKVVKKYNFQSRQWERV